jgi:prephenate dehydratase
MTVKVAFLGPKGTVSEEAARFFLGNHGWAFVPYKHFSEVFGAVDDGHCQFGVIPIENTIEGSVSLHVDWLVNEVNIPIQSEWVYPSLQNLIGHADDYRDGNGQIDLSGIKRITSHPVAISQCRQFLRTNLPQVELEAANSTAEGVRLVKQQSGEGLAAIGTRLAAQTYGLDVLAENVHDHDQNFTRFLLIGHQQVQFQRLNGIEKTSMLITLPEDYPGALHQVLSAFAWRRINLTKIESRPTKKKLGSYYFYVDVQLSMQSVLLPSAIEEIEALGGSVRVLGSYWSYPYDEGTDNA